MIVVPKENIGTDGQDGFREKHCPFIKNARAECYCHEMNSRKITLAIRFCLKEYENCRIYRRLFLDDGLHD